MKEAVEQAGPCSAIGVGTEQGEIVERLAACLAAAYVTHDLRRREVRAMERAVRRLDRHGMAPSANEFWGSTALPRAQRLIDECRHIIDRDLAALWHSAESSGRGLLVTGAELRRAVPRPEAIDALGSWWQQRLRRVALARSALALLARSPAQAELIIANHEMALLDAAPWAHGDRLLSAFELAHGEIGRHADAGVERLLVDADRCRWSGSLRSSRRRSLQRSGT